MERGKPENPDNASFQLPRNVYLSLFLFLPDPDKMLLESIRGFVLVRDVGLGEILTTRKGVEQVSFGHPFNCFVLA